MKYQVSFVTDTHSKFATVQTMIIHNKGFLYHFITTGRPLHNGFWVDIDKRPTENPANFVSFVLPHMITNITARHDL